jgi:hypothetical protein
LNYHALERAGEGSAPAAANENPIPLTEKDVQRAGLVNSLQTVSHAETAHWQETYQGMASGPKNGERILPRCRKLASTIPKKEQHFEGLEIVL